MTSAVAPRDATSPPRLRLEPRWRRVDVVVVVTLMGALLVAQQVLRAMTDDGQDYWGPAGVALAMFPTMTCGGVVLFLARRRRLNLRELGFTRPLSWRPSLVAWIGSIAAGPAFAGVVAIFGVQAWEPFRLLELYSPAAVRSVAAVGWYALGVVVIAPFVEELVFRGLLYRAFRQRWALAPALALSGIVFAAAHFDALTFAPLLFVGVLLGWAYERSGSIWGSIVPHAGLNLLTLIALLARAG